MSLLSNRLFILFRGLLVFLLAGVPFLGTYPGRAFQPDSPGRIFASGSSPQGLPAQLPVYHMLYPPADSQTAQGVASLFEGLVLTDIITDTAYNGTPSYQVADTRTGFILQQYGATGGFNAYNATRAFEETPANLDYGPNLICDFLLINELFPGDMRPEDQNCNGNLAYPSELIYNSILTPTLDAAGRPDLSREPLESTTEIVGQVWHVPLAIDVAPALGRQVPYYLPIGGPGGHLSLLLTGYDNSPSLDSSLPGLQALAMPYFGRQHTVIGLYDVVTPTLAAQQFMAIARAQIPGAEIDPGTPVLEYYAGDVASHQPAMMPVWSFPDATALVDGEIVNLKVISLPAVSGFLPEVAFTDPPDGTPFVPGHPFDLQAAISGNGPFTYTLSTEDGTPLLTGTTPGGPLDLPVPSLPSENRPGEPAVHFLLSATDINGGSSAASLTLQAQFNHLFLPLIQDGVSPAASVAAEQPQIPLTMGVEWIQYYNGTNPDLSGVPPDANGFYNSLKGLGWTGTFNWGNNNAWEKDWRDVTLGGGDSTYGVDRALMAYFSGHGSPARIYFGTSKDYLNAWGGNARFQNLRWAFFSSCQTLRAGPYVGPGNPPLTDWFNSFQGDYMLLGFHSNMGDIAYGPWLVWNMRPWIFNGFQQLSIREAWSMTAFMLNAGKPAYLYAVNPGFNPENFILPYSSTSLPALTYITGFRWTWWD